MVDDADAERKGFETVSTAIAPFVGTGYRHDGNATAASSQAKFVADLPEAGKYEVRLAYTANPNRATNVPVIVAYAGGTATVKVNQSKRPPIDGLWVSLGAFAFAEREGRLQSTVFNRDANGFVVIDAVQWLPVKE